MIRFVTLLLVTNQVKCQKKRKEKVQAEIQNDIPAVNWSINDDLEDILGEVKSTMLAMIGKHRF